MAKTFQSFASKTIADLVADVNAYLATLVDGDALVIVGFDIVLNDLDRYEGTQFSCMITTDDTGAAALADPYVLTIFNERSTTDLDTAVAAYLAANADFTTGVRNLTFAMNPSLLPKVTAWAVASEDATNGPTNWALK